MSRWLRRGVVVALLLATSGCSAIFPLSSAGPDPEADGGRLDGSAGADASTEADAAADADAGGDPDGGDGGGPCETCPPGEECVDGVCSPCGADGEPCCAAGDPCGPGLRCVPGEGTCRPTLCGGPGQECCDSSPRCSSGECAGEACPECGGLGEQCCDPGGCDPDLACEEGAVCGTCGNAICDPGETCATCKDCACPGLQDCFVGICFDPTCVDLRQNGLETDVDCGGADCGPCDEGEGCLVDLDCGIASFQQGCRDAWHVQHRSVTHVCLDGSCETRYSAWGDTVICGDPEVFDCGYGICQSCQRPVLYGGNTCELGEGCSGDWVDEERCEDDCTCNEKACC
ncbi:MAG: hypothetical protein HYY06_27535 [Deltaproteobacteria bacterium]|nr:hypothetical protein [Deltaproteobacteria bacterium]